MSDWSLADWSLTDWSLDVGDEPPAEDAPPSGAFIRQRPRPPIIPVAINDDDEVLLLLAL